MFGVSKSVLTAVEPICNSTQHPDKDNCVADEDGASRWQDNMELKYSLRSVVAHAPWIRNIYIVTNGQIPHWLNLNHPRLKVIPHDLIFRNLSHLPTFSSPAIEANLHRIPGISSKFIYLNDDVMFGSPIWPSDFYTRSHGQKIFLAWAVPNCADGCPSNWIGDGYCDHACNVSSCDFDAHDCDNVTAGSQPQVGRHTYGQSNLNSNTNYCARGCPDSWVGDKYCDRMCDNAECGWDAGDCGIEKVLQLPGTVVTLATHHLNITGHAAYYFNLSFVNNLTITDGSHDNSDIWKVMTLTFHRNVTGLVAVSVSAGEGAQALEHNWNLTVDTQHLVNASQATSPSSAAHSPPSPRSPARAPSPRPAGRTPPPPPPSRLRPKSPPTPPPPEPLAAAEEPVPGPVPKEEEEGKDEIQEEHNGKEEKERKNKTKPAEPEVEADLGGTPLPPETEPSPEPSPKPSPTTEAPSPPPPPPPPPSPPPPAPPAQADAGPKPKRVGRKPKPQPQPAVNRSSNKPAPEQPGGRGLLWIHEADLVPADADASGHPVPSQAAWEESEFLAYRAAKTEALARAGALSLDPHVLSPARPARRRLSQPLHGRQRSLLEVDMYASSLKHVNAMYNKAFGVEARRVPAHMPHLIDVSIMTELQALFPDEWDATSSHQLRHPKDMQYAFAYMYYVMNCRVNFTLEEYFRSTLDLDGNGVLDEVELRTLALILHDNQNKAMPEHKLTELKEQLNEANWKQPGWQGFTDRPVTVETLRSAEEVVKKLEKLAAKRRKFKSEEKGTDDVGFVMVPTNHTQAQQRLDGIRVRRHKFICVNDNMNHSDPESRKTVRVIHDFFLSLYPNPSPFELVTEVNPYLHLDEFENFTAVQQSERATSYLALGAGLLCFCLLVRLLPCCRTTDRAHREQRTRNFLSEI